MNHLFPVNLNLRGRKCLVIGGGRVAERKVRSLLQCGADVCVVSPELTEALEELAAEGAVTAVARRYISDDLSGCFLVISAADDHEVNRRVADECRARNIPVNVVDSPEMCSFTVPSVLRRGSLCIAVSTEGKSPLLARKIRAELESQFGREYAEFLDLIGEVRKRVIRDVRDPRRRRRILQCLIDSDILELIKAGRRDLVEEQIARCISL